MTARELVEKIGPGFHPDTPLEDYVSMETGEQFFTETELEEMRPAFEGRHDWYSIYMELFGARLVDGPEEIRL